MSLNEVFLSQGIVGVVLPLSFALLAILAIILGITKSKSSGYACLAGAWSIGTAHTAFVASNMVALAKMEAGAATFVMFATAMSAISYFSRAAVIVSLVVVMVMAAARFNKKHLLSEILIIIALCLVYATIRLYMHAIYLVFTA